MENANFTAIKPLWDQMPLSTAPSAKSQGTDGAALFADIFRSAIDNVKQTDAESNRAQYLMAVGELDNPAELSITSTKAAMSLEMLIQLRNKALDAYSELMRISL